MSTAIVLAPSILVVDASAASRTHVAGLIRNRWPDARLAEADAAAGTLEEMKELSADLVIIDLPGSAGMALAQRLRKAHPACQVALAAEPGTAASRAKADAARIRLVRRPLVGDVVEQILALVGWDD